jgi:site-specific DNA-methyltransferase (adenine-specific)
MINLHLGDCLEFMKGLDTASVDAVITDPPYGIGIAANPFRQKFERSDWDNKPVSKEILDEIFRVSKAQVLWGGNYFELPPTQCYLIWDKKQPQKFSSAMCEMAWTSFKKPAKMFRFSVTSYFKEHPTQKPLPLMEWIIANYTNEGDTILDPFMGSGTTGVACVKLGRNFIGAEIHEPYFAIAQRRIAEAQLQAPLPALA